MRAEAVTRLYEQERLLADQAASGLLGVFGHFEQDMRFIATQPGVVEADASGLALFRAFYEARKSDIAGITRVDPAGRILYSFPDESVAGRDISAQDHVRRVMATRRHTLSGVFTTVQGYRAVAMHTPVWRGDAFAGSVAFLIPFEPLARPLLAGIRIGEGYALLADQEGILLFSPLPDEVGKPLAESSMARGGLAPLAAAMATGEPGRLALESLAEDGRARRDYARHRPISFGGITWSVAVVAPESEAIAYVAAFRDRWILAMSAFAALLGVWTLLFLRAMARGRRQEELERLSAELERAVAARTAELEEAQGRLIEGERMATLGKLVAGIAHQLNSPLAALIAANESLRRVLGDELVELLDFHAALSAGERRDFSTLLQAAARRLESAPSPPASMIRSERAKARAALAEAGLASPEEVADDVADLGLLADLPELLPVVAAPGGAMLLSRVRDLASALASIRIVSDSAIRAAEAVALLDTYLGPSTEARPAPIDPGPGIRAVLEAEVVATRVSIALDVRIEPGLLVLAVSERLERVWKCIVSNALQAMGIEGRLEVRAERRAEKVIVSFTDSGPGIPEEIAPRVFEPFFTTKRRGEGSGLGLDIARRLAEEAGGGVSFESVPGRTTFFVTLPAARPEPGA